MLTIAETAARIGRSPDTVRRWVREGRLPARQVDGRRAPNWVAALHRSRAGR
ncbi:helix-turn-helix domain-containing protein [Conexibacter sp. CPCC 206217]|uniref:helix-turn-helix domain-containing protein n=1 Tax=Conexibacter sp. CPCC 206217 TaxID=3064574 RepID=UPI00351C0EDD